MKQSLSLNILRLCLLLVLIGFFLPVACDLSGYQIAQGILGHTQKDRRMPSLGRITSGFSVFSDSSERGKETNRTRAWAVGCDFSR